MTKLRVSNVHWSIQMSVLAGPDAQCAPTQRQRIRSFLMRQKCSFSTQSNTKTQDNPRLGEACSQTGCCILILWNKNNIDIRCKMAEHSKRFTICEHEEYNIFQNWKDANTSPPCFLERIMLASCNTARYIQYVRWGLSTSYMKNLCLIKLIKKLWLKPAAIFACFCFVCFYFDDLWII